MIIDSFMFFNEYDILEGRLEYLYDHVDYFVLVESNLTHGGKPKPLHFMENMSRFKPYLDKVLYFPFAAAASQFEYDKKPKHDHDFDTGPWQMENAQRNYIAKALEFFPSDAVVMIGDVDEIPHKDCISIAQRSFSENWQIFAIQQFYHCYNFNQRMKNMWHGTVITTNGFVKTQTPQGCRNIKYNIPVIPNGGWHFTYWGGAEQIKTKIQNFAHQELNNDTFTNIDYIKQQIASGKDLYNRPYNETETVDPNYIPEDVRRIFGKYQ